MGGFLIPVKHSLYLQKAYKIDKIIKTVSEKS
jgi:hypothetical protein